MQAEQKLQFEPGGSERLFLGLGEELKLPLQHIARQAELGLLVDHEPDSEMLMRIRTSAVTSLQLIDSYLLSVRLAQAPAERFTLEPVSVAAVLHDARNQLSRLAKDYGVTLELHVDGRYGPVLAHEAALRTALVSLGYSLLEGVSAQGDKQLTLRLAAHKTKHGIVAGLYCDAWDLTPKMLRTAQKLHGVVRQPAVSLLPGSGAGMFVADAIVQAMSSRLRVGRYQKASGIVVTLPLSPQLQLV